MAIDSASKRQSALMFGLRFYPKVIIPDGTVSQGDKQTGLGMYSGILATASAEPAGYRRRRIRNIASWRHGLGGRM